MKKQPVQKTTEELLNDLNSESINEIAEEKIQSEDTVLMFLRFYNIEPGTYPIKDTYLYKLYKQFTIEQVTSKKFQKALGYYLKFVNPNKPKRNLKGKYYLINKKLLNLSEKALELVKNEDKTAQHKSLAWKAHFDGFLKRYEIKAGKDEFIWASTNTLFNLYDKWTYEIKRKIGLSRREFNQLCKAYFEYKQDKTNTLWFKITDITKDKKSETKARNSLTNEKEEQKE